MVTACAHHWIIENPDGHTSRGVCKRCGAARSFRNAEQYGRNSWLRRKDGAQQNTQQNNRNGRAAPERPRR